MLTKYVFQKSVNIFKNSQRYLITYMQKRNEKSIIKYFTTFIYAWKEEGAREKYIMIN